MAAYLVFAAAALVAFQARSAEPSNGSGKSTPKYILFLTADGFRTDYIEWYHPTNLLQLITEGVRVIHATNVFPTVTAPNMCSLVTGSYPRTTGIACNSQYVRELDQIVKSPRDNKAETIAETLQKAGWKTAAVNHFMLKDRGTDIYTAPGYDDSEKATDAILEILQKKEARFIGAIYGETDHAGHDHGPESKEVKTAVLNIDRAVGRLVRGLKDLGIYGETLIAFNSDHGMSPFEKKQISVEPAKALASAGFKVAMSESTLSTDTQIVVISLGVRLIYFRKPLADDQQQKIMKALAGIEGAEVLDRKKLDELGCHASRSGDLIVTPLPGYTMSRAGANGGQHGRFTEQNPVMFFRGPGIKQGATVDAAKTIDVVPTVLRLINVTPAKTVEGKPIVEAWQR
jgi:predicted AlkP superfamily pyrophosphatase or phosphodiesterase